MRLTSLLIAFTLLISSLPGNTRDLPPGVSLLPPHSLSAYHLPVTSAGFNIKTVAVSGMSFQHAALCTTVQTPNNIWDY